LKGRCFSGKFSAYWTYTYCYKGEINQFHLNDKGQKTWEIKLGKYAESSPEEVKWKGHHNPHFTYSHEHNQGNFCDETKSHRVTIVKFECLMQKERTSVLPTPASVGLQYQMFLEEKSTCVYSLSFQTPLLCPNLWSSFINLDDDDLQQMADLRELHSQETKGNKQPQKQKTGSKNENPQKSEEKQEQPQQENINLQFVPPEGVYEVIFDQTGKAIYRTNHHPLESQHLNQNQMQNQQPKEEVHDATAQSGIPLDEHGNLVTNQMPEIRIMQNQDPQYSQTETPSEQIKEENEEEIQEGSKESKKEEPIERGLPM